MSRRAFTFDEAVGLLPGLRQTVARIESHAEEARRLGDKLGVLDALWGERAGDPDVPDHEEFIALRSALETVDRRIGRIVQEEIVQLGVRLPPGGIEHGLLDFPTTLDGRWVFLCWQVDEPTLGFWHEVSAGFAGRQAIVPELAGRFGRPHSGD